MDSEQDSASRLVSSLYDYVKTETALKDGKSLSKFNSEIKHVDCEIIQTHIVNGFTLLQHAAKEGLVDFVQSILELNIDPNFVDNDNITQYEEQNTAILLAAEGGHWKIIELFCEHKISADNGSTQHSFDSTDCLSEIPINFRALAQNNDTILHILIKRPKLKELIKRKWKLKVTATKEDILSLKRQWKILNIGYLKCVECLLWNETPLFDPKNQL